MTNGMYLDDVFGSHHPYGMENLLVSNVLSFCPYGTDTDNQIDGLLPKLLNL